MSDDIFERLIRCTGFQWDSGNKGKVEERHEVRPAECEQVFFADPLLIAPDTKHSRGEERWAALGRTAQGRTLAIVFTLRGERIRPIAARDMNRKERRLYAEAEGEADS